jgi:hypothetical protein
MKQTTNLPSEKILGGLGLSGGRCFGSAGRVLPTLLSSGYPCPDCALQMKNAQCSMLNEEEPSSVPPPLDQ